LRCAHALARPSQNTLIQVINGTPTVAAITTRKLPRAAGPKMKSDLAARKSANGASWAQVDTVAAASEGRELTTLPKVAYLTRIWSEAHHKYYQTRPFVDANSPANIMSEEFAKTLGVFDAHLDKDDQRNAKNAAGQTIENSGSIQLRALICRQGHREPETRQLTFHVKKTAPNVVGDVVFGRDVFGGVTSSSINLGNE
jgi:hypothetical protein